MYLFFCIQVACSTTNSKPLLIDFSADSTCIVFSNIDRPGLLQLTGVATQDSVLNSLISVLQTPSETDSLTKETPLAGKLTITDTNIVFKPFRPFLRGNDYLVITYLNARFGTEEQILKSQLNTAVRPHQVVLTR
ncbi:hypothetical protein [Pedobacter psychroterrae]|uniref:Uncharacterized protein n=1 Tax=Pedobacter psychroterrae TaxID=2530453 RepID=A0A4V2MLT4_9SPHI|nr:hypothetical protein [Pedobacter psychroterrae]TCD03297.1 hypothetical protein EZ437_04815 [Pedobacter psychroterrae]